VFAATFLAASATYIVMSTRHGEPERPGAPAPDAAAGLPGT
jgi:hypothetical protein